MEEYVTTAEPQQRRVVHRIAARRRIAARICAQSGVGYRYMLMKFILLLKGSQAIARVASSWAPPPSSRAPERLAPARQAIAGVLYAIIGMGKLLLS